MSHESPSTGRRLKRRAVLMLIVVFALGLLVGVTAERLRAAAQGQAVSGRSFHPDRLPRLFNNIDLTEAQREQVREIMERHRPHMEEVLGEMHPRLKAVMDSARAEIDEILTAEQRAALQEQMKAGRQRHGWRRGHGRGRTQNRTHSRTQSRTEKSPPDSAAGEF